MSYDSCIMPLTHLAGSANLSASKTYETRQATVNSHKT